MYRAPPSESPRSLRSLAALRRRRTVERVSRIMTNTMGQKPPMMMNWIQLTQRQPRSTSVNAMVVPPNPVPKIAQKPKSCVSDTTWAD